MTRKKRSVVPPDRSAGKQSHERDETPSGDLPIQEHREIGARGNHTAAYTVGYGKPPVASRFKAGASGNPKGRPKGARSLPSLIKDELGRKVAVRENGRDIEVTKKQLLAKQLVNKAASGDPKAIRAITSLDPAELSPASASNVEGRTEGLTEAERAQIGRYLGYVAHKFDGVERGDE